MLHKALFQYCVRSAEDFTNLSKSITRPIAFPHKWLFYGHTERITLLGINFCASRACYVAQWQSFLHRDYKFPKERMTDDAEISPLVENRGQHLKLLFCRRGQELHPTVWTTAYAF